MNFPSRYMILPAAAVVVLAQPARAQEETKAEAFVSAGQAAVGDQIVYAIRISGAQSLESRPADIEVEGLNFQFAGTNNSIRGGTGGFSRSLELRYMVTAEAAGEYTIPAQTLQVNGQAISTEAVTLKITDAPPLPENVAPVVQLRAGKTELWKGELASVTVSMYVPDQTDVIGMLTAQIPSQGIAVERFDRPAMQSIEPLNGQIFRTYRLQSIFTTLKSGDITLGPAEVKTDIFVPQGGIRDPFGGVPQMRRTIKVESNPVTLHVKELPTEGRPPVSGEIAVGRFSLSVIPDRTSAVLGEPLALDIQVTGQGNFDLLQAPQIETPDGWRLYNPRVTQEARGWGTEGSVRAWAQVIVPEKNLTELPPFTVHTFDPDQGKYVTLRSQPVALTITGDAAAFQQQAKTLSGVRDFGGPVESPPPDPDLQDILADPLRNAVLTGTVARPSITPVTLHICGAAVLGLVMLGGLAKRMKEAAAVRAARARQPREPAEILSAMRRSGISQSELYQLAGEFIQSWQFHKKQPLPAEGETGAALQQLFVSRDRCLYSRTGSPEQPATREEQQAVTGVLARL